MSKKLTQAAVVTLLLSNLLLLGKLGLSDAQAQEATAPTQEICHAFHVRSSTLARGSESHEEPSDATSLPPGWRSVGGASSSFPHVIACKTLP